MVTWLIDISNHQGAFDVSRAVSEGYSGVWMKATEGTSFRDGRFDTFARQALATSAIPGAYHYLRAGSGRAQCDAFYGRIRDHGGPGGWLAACDNEADASWQTTVDFFTRWHELAGDHPLFMYSGNWWWGPRGWNGASLTPYLWDSRYVSGSGSGPTLYQKVPASWWSSRYGGWGSVTMLQFASSATVAGRSPIDVNAFRGSVGDLRALTGQRTTTRRSTMILAYVPGQPTIVPTDWATWHDIVTYEQTQEMLSDGVPMVRVTPAQMTRILTLPLPDAANAAVMSAIGAVRDLVAALSTGAVDVAALAAALAPLLTTAPTAAEVADAVADETASRLAD